MDLNQLSSLIMNLSTLVFVVTSMLAMGLSLSVSQILAPLRNARLVILFSKIVVAVAMLPGRIPLLFL
jgi:BASS family bile acid:Na+ symporter